MKVINAGKYLYSLEGNILPTSTTDKMPITIGRSIAAILLGHKGRKFDPMKLLELARKFYNASKEIEIDNSDLEGLKSIVNSDEQFLSLVTGQVLEELTNAKEPEVNKPIDISEARKNAAAVS